MDTNSLMGFHRADHQRSLFPLETNRILVDSAAQRIEEYLSLNLDLDGTPIIAPQASVYCEKRGRHLRKTFKLDPAADFLLHRLVYKNRKYFRRGLSRSRLSFGYDFENGEVIAPRIAFQSFQKAVRTGANQYAHCVKMDVASYFGSIYHHDLVQWFEKVTSSTPDSIQLGAFLRKINAGRSVGCLPQGIIPAKILGSHFLNFIDRSKRVRSELMLRFMDDIYIFSDSKQTILDDFFVVQELLASKGLSLNASKTEFDGMGESTLEGEVDEMRASLWDRELDFATASGEGAITDDEEWDENDPVLSEEQSEYLFELLRQESIEEDDAELILNLMQDHGDEVLEYLERFLVEFPNLSKSVFHFCSHVADTTELGNLVFKFIDNTELLSDFQLFWLAKLAESQLSRTPRYGDILVEIMEHPCASPVVKAKVLEIPERDHGVFEMREQNLRSGSSDWLSWSSAVGVRSEPKSSRNHLLKYFRSGSPLNGLIADAISSLPSSLAQPVEGSSGQSTFT